MYIRARPPIRVVSPYSPACVCVCVDAARLGLFCVCWAISGPVQQVCAVYISAVAHGQERANVNWAPGPGAVKRYLFLYFPFSIFSPKKEKKKPMSLVQSFTTGGGALSWALEWWADKPEKRDAMGYEETIWTIEKSEERAGVSWQIYWPYFIHSLGPGFPWLNSAWPSLSLSYYLWGPTKNTGGTAAAEEPNLADKIRRSTGNPPAGTARTHKRKIAHGKNISKTWKWNLKKKKMVPSTL